MSLSVLFKSFEFWQSESSAVRPGARAVPARRRGCAGRPTFSQMPCSTVTPAHSQGSGALVWLRQMMGLAVFSDCRQRQVAAGFAGIDGPMPCRRRGHYLRLPCAAGILTLISLADMISATGVCSGCL